MHGHLYGFGRLAWNPALSASAIAEMTRRLLGNDPAVVRKISKMQLTSWPTYENTTGRWALRHSRILEPLWPRYRILRTMLGHAPSDAKYRPGTDRRDWKRLRWAISSAVAASTILESTPDDLLLFFHHVLTLCAALRKDVSSTITIPTTMAQISSRLVQHGILSKAVLMMRATPSLISLEYQPDTPSFCLARPIAIGFSGAPDSRRERSAESSGRVERKPCNLKLHTFE